MDCEDSQCLSEESGCSGRTLFEVNIRKNRRGSSEVLAENERGESEYSSHGGRRCTENRGQKRRQVPANVTLKVYLEESGKDHRKGFLRGITSSSSKKEVTDLKFRKALKPCVEVSSKEKDRKKPVLIDTTQTEKGKVDSCIKSNEGKGKLSNSQVESTYRKECGCECHSLVEDLRSQLEESKQEIQKFKSRFRSIGKQIEVVESNMNSSLTMIKETSDRNSVEHNDENTRVKIHEKSVGNASKNGMNVQDTARSIIPDNTKYSTDVHRVLEFIWMVYEIHSYDNSVFLSNKHTKKFVHELRIYVSGLLTSKTYTEDNVSMVYSANGTRLDTNRSEHLIDNLESNRTRFHPHEPSQLPKVQIPKLSIGLVDNNNNNSFNLLSTQGRNLDTNRLVGEDTFRAGLYDAKMGEFNESKNPIMSQRSNQWMYSIDKVDVSYLNNYPQPDVSEDLCEFAQSGFYRVLENEYNDENDQLTFPDRVLPVDREEGSIENKNEAKRNPSQDSAFRETRFRDSITKKLVESLNFTSLRNESMSQRKTNEVVANLSERKSSASYSTNKYFKKYAKPSQHNTTPKRIHKGKGNSNQSNDVVPNNKKPGLDARKLDYILR